MINRQATSSATPFPTELMVDWYQVRRRENRFIVSMAGNSCCAESQERHALQTNVDDALRASGSFEETHHRPPPSALDVFGSSFSSSQNYEYSYVRATNPTIRQTHKGQVAPTQTQLVSTQFSCSVTISKTISLHRRRETQ